MTSHLREPFRRPTTDGHPPVDLAAVDRLMTNELAVASIPGAPTRGDQVLHVRGYGHDADDVPITEDTRFRVALLSKSSVRGSRASPSKPGQCPGATRPSCAQTDGIEKRSS